MVSFFFLLFCFVPFGLILMTEPLLRIIIYLVLFGACLVWFLPFSGLGATPSLRFRSRDYFRGE